MKKVDNILHRECCYYYTYIVIIWINYQCNKIFTINYKKKPNSWTENFPIDTIGTTTDRKLWEYKTVHQAYFESSQWYIYLAKCYLP